MTDNLELPLKAPQETFIDEPKELNDVNIHDLVSDFEQGLKDINKLHVFESMSVMMYTLEDIIKLKEKPELFNQYRNERLEKEGVTTNIKHDTLDNVDDETRITPPNSPPSKLMKMDNSDPNLLRETTPDSLIDDISGSSNPPSHVTIDYLVQHTDLDKDYGVNFNDISDEFNYYHTSGIKDQITRLVKAFNLVQVPKLSIGQFLTRIKTYSSSISSVCYIHATFMIYKLCVLLNVVPLTIYNVHRIILALIRCLTKKLEDIYQKQKSFATVGGVSRKDLHQIEVAFLFVCNFRLVVSEDVLNDYLKEFTQLRTFCQAHNEELSST